MVEDAFVRVALVAVRLVGFNVLIDRLVIVAEVIVAFTIFEEEALVVVAYSVVR